MASEHLNFTISALKALPLPPAGKVAYYTDSNKSAPVGFGLWVSSGGAKTFMVYRKVNGRPSRLKVGHFPGLSIEQARKKAAEINGSIAKGIDPAAHKRGARGEMSLGTLFEEYLTRYAIPQGKKTIDAMREDFARYLGEVKAGSTKKHGRERVKPAGAVNWKNRKPSTLTKDDVQRWHTALGKNSGKYAANRALQLLRAVLNWGLSTKLVERKYLEDAENPAAGIALFRENTRERFIQADELPRFFKALAEEPNDTIRDCVLLSLLTGARRANVLEMKWAHLHLERGTWEIAQTKNGDAQTIPLTSEAIEVLKAREARKVGEYVFPGDGATGHLASPKAGWKRILQRAKLDNVRLHDLRRTLGSWQAATGASLSVIGKTLGHKEVSTTAIYARLNLDPIRAAMQTATSAMMGAGGLTPKAQVVKLKKAK